MRLATSPSDKGECEGGEEVEQSLLPRHPGERLPGLEKLYRAHAARLRSFFARRLGREDAQDLVQETFLRVARMDQLATGEIRKEEAYLGTVARNLLKDRAKAAARAALKRHGLYEELAKSTADPHRLLEDREALARLELGLKRLGSQRRRIFLLHRVEHLTYAQIAAETGMSVKGVKKQMAKALLQLRTAIDRG
jgi:RNA polymerase sigma-70 factor (ECF subfamily)